MACWFLALAWAQATTDSHSSPLFSFFLQGPQPPVRQDGYQEERCTEHHGQCTAAPSWVETDADYPKGHCSPPQGAAQAKAPFKQTIAVKQIASHTIEGSQHQARGLFRRLPELNVQIHE